MTTTTEQAIALADQANAATALEQALAQQPQLVPGLDKLGECCLGDVRVDLYGKLLHFGRRVEVDIEDITLAGTTVSMSTLVGVKRWKKIEDDLQACIERNL